MAFKEVTTECLYLNNALKYLNNKLQLQIPLLTIPLILTDNEGAKKLAENPEFHKRTKHIDIIYHFVREHIRNNELMIRFVPIK